MRRVPLNDLSSRLTNYLIEKKGLTVSEIALMAGVDKSFVSRVKSAQREWSVDHLDRLSTAMNVEIGALLMAATGPKRSSDPKKQKLIDLCEEVTRLADIAIAKLRKSAKSDAA